MTETRKDRLNRMKNTRQKRERKRLFYQLLFLFLTAMALIYFLQQQDINETKTKTAKIEHHLSEKKTPLKKALSPKVKDVMNEPAIDEYLKSSHFNGTALVVKDNKVLINKGYGFANIENKLPNNSETVFYIGSITKVFISTSVMQLQVQGKLNVHDPVAKYIPDFPNGDKILLYHLLTHTSGIPEHSETRQKISHDDLIKKIEQGPLKFQPGTQWNYSDSNYSILAYIVEKVSGETLETYVKHHIFDPAGMKHTGFGEEYSKEPYVSKGYKKKDDQLISPTLPDMSELFGCGDIYTTPYDLYLFDKALYSEKLLPKDSLKQFFTPFKNNYGMGLYSDPGSYSDHGVLPGWNALNSFSKSGRKFIVLLSNIQNGVSSLGTVNNQIYLMLNNY
ncbi:serine hydrolase domain-containing protein [Bacillota bacterium Lsc_1132]